MPDARCTRGLACKRQKENAHEHTGSAEALRHSLRNGFTAYSALLCPQNLPECANGRVSPTARRLLFARSRSEGIEPARVRGTGPVSSSTRTVARASSPYRARKGAG